VLWFAVRQTTGPLRRLATNVRALGTDLRTPDAKVEGSAETRALAQAFNDMKARISGLVDERTFILAGIAHDMRTYLTRLRLRADFIDDPQQREKAEQDLDQMSTLLDDNLLFAGIDRSTVAALEAVDIGKATDDFVEARIDAGHIRTQVAAGTAVMADRAGLERIFGNLVDNGLRHAAHISVSTAVEGDHVLWCFDDDGPGVDAGVIPRLGQAYLRLDPSRDRRTGGAGLGLAIVRALAEAMGGKVHFSQSALGGLRACVELRRA
jgi:signal transduction histidine kinase